MPAMQMYRASVTDNVDPSQQGRVKVRLLSTDDTAVQEQWAVVPTLALGAGLVSRPTYRIGDPVIIASAGPDAADPLVLGGLGAPASQTPPGDQLRLSTGADGLTIQLGDATAITLGHDGALAITTSSRLTLRAAHVTVQGDHVSVEAGLCQVSGTLKCDTLITNSVVSASYTPGAGNIS